MSLDHFHHFDILRSKKFVLENILPYNGYKGKGEKNNLIGSGGEFNINSNLESQLQTNFGITRCNISIKKQPVSRVN